MAKKKYDDWQVKGLKRYEPSWHIYSIIRRARPDLDPRTVEELATVLSRRLGLDPKPEERTLDFDKLMREGPSRPPKKYREPKYILKHEDPPKSFNHMKRARLQGYFTIESERECYERTLDLIERGHRKIKRVKVRGAKWDFGKGFTYESEYEHVEDKVFKGVVNGTDKNAAVWAWLEMEGDELLPNEEDILEQRRKELEV